MSTYFKDFNKDVKDLLTKNYTDAGKWKIESKFKGPKDTVYVNPQATNDGVAVDVEYNFGSFPEKLKVNLTPKLEPKVTATYEDHGHKVEVVTNTALDFEVVHETKFDPVAVHNKLTKKALDVGLSVNVASHCQVGGSVNYGFDKGAINWAAGARYSNAGYLVSLTTHALSNYQTSLLVPLDLAGNKVTLGSQIDCHKGGCNWQVAAETKCLLCPASNVRVKVNDKLKWAVAHISKLSDNWKVAVSIDESLNPGLLLTRE